MTESLDLPFLEERPSVRGRVAHALRAALVAGQMRPGEVYSAPTLAAQFGVSPTPVREAMLDLVKEGLVETVRNKGFRVTELSDQELDNITEIRQLIEVPATVKAIDIATADDLARLRPMAQRIVDVAQERDLIAYIEHDRRFHLELLSLMGNAHLVSLVGELRARSRLFGLTRLAESGELGTSALEHIQMLDLIAAKDRSGLERLMKAHIGHVRGSWAGRDEEPRRR
ncbi:MULTISPECIES: GntR family transcriptional regulator [Micromonospora]|uniref:GntR family transcriptional regulator n=1 Tax=Micromonospora sicca TaxID=2202420 RepID=A0A317DR56_9ACTN|nr:MULTISPECIES: GntR family transcriptional regulator [unclassified Micromonospora]MBM0226748.1 GntR family transcriptional regulator [Micromonospora sp. ATA51]PWR15323.1 GntR family transcriptional regulator [Micromonospora sp. 4G51]